MNTRRLAVFNNKGGCGKSSSVINIAYFMQRSGHRVLVVDCDTQENCFLFFLTSHVQDVILPTDYTNLSHTTWERFRTLPQSVLDDFDFILFDLPPTFSDEVRGILRQCDAVYVPIILGEFEISGLKNVSDEINSLGIRLGGIFVTMFQAKTDNALMRDVRSALQERMMETVIPYSQTVRQSQKSGLPLEPYFLMRGTPKTPRTWKIVYAYENLTREILRREC